MSRVAQPAAERFLRLFRPSQWQYYLNKVLTGDRRVLEKLAYDDGPLERWQELVSEYGLSDLKLPPRIAKMVTADNAKQLEIKRIAAQHRERIMQEA